MHIGYAFVGFRDEASAASALREPGPHYIDHKKINIRPPNNNESEKPLPLYSQHYQSTETHSTSGVSSIVL